MADHGLASNRTDQVVQVAQAGERNAQEGPVHLQMIYWGINALNHGSSLAVLHDDYLMSWTVEKNDQFSDAVIKQALCMGQPDEIFWYENPWLKKSRQLFAGQYAAALDRKVLPKHYLSSIGLRSTLTYTPHHASHAAAGYYTSPFYHAAIVVLDAIGEWDCASIWQAQGKQIRKIWSRRYPHSLGLFYSAFTKLVGLEPIRDEGIFQQLSRSGDSTRYQDDIREYMSGMIQAEKNLHRGVYDWPYPPVTDKDRRDIAAAVQAVFEQQVSTVMQLAKTLTNCDNLVYMGGCAMNSQANRAVVEPHWRQIWSLPQPGDPSSAIGAVLYHTQQRIRNYDWGPVKHIAINIG